MQRSRKKLCPKKEQQKSENDYDADSEQDQKCDSATDPDSDSKSCKMIVSTDSENERKENQLRRGKAQYRRKLPGQMEEEPYSIPARNRIDKENFTPPDSHSTPSHNQRVVRNLDDSLFGFNNLESPLPYSPVSSASSQARPSPCTSRKQISLSAAKPQKGKRKHDQLFGFPKEEQKKGKKKRTQKEVCFVVIIFASGSCLVGLKAPCFICHNDCECYIVIFTYLAKT